MMICFRNMNGMADIHYSDTPIITEYDQQGFVVDHVRFNGAISVLGVEEFGYAITSVNANAELSADDLHRLSDLAEDPHLLVSGVGESMTHPYYDLRGKLMEIGLKGEILPTSAACRTWNLLLSEGRKVAFLAVPAAKSADHKRQKVNG